jgi:hypothetical protein
MTDSTIQCVLVAGLVVAALAGVASGVAVEDPDDETPTVALASYYGEVTIDGEPAPAGTTVTAVIDGETRGSVTLTENGKLGASTVGSDLVVSGPQSDVGSTVTFLVDGERAEVVDGTTTIETATPRRHQITLAVGADSDGSAGESPPETGSDAGDTGTQADEPAPDASESPTDQEPADDSPEASNETTAKQSPSESGETTETSAEDASESSESEGQSESASTSDAATDSSGNVESTPGFGVLLSLFVLSIVAFSVRRRVN